MNSKVAIFILFVTVTLSSPFIKVANANSIVCMNSSLGDYCLELFDDIAPVTVTNFLSYVDAGYYDNIIFHRSAPGFILQSGGFTINDDIALTEVTNNGSIVNEYQLSNTRGTIAMAKLSGDPDSASNQWFINLADNSANLDNQNEGFTVFGRVIGNGMAIIDSTSNLTRYNFGGVLTETPTINYDGGETINQENFVFIDKAQKLIEDKETATFQSNYLIAVVDAGVLGIYNLKFKLTEVTPKYKFALDLSLIRKPSIDSKIQATFDSASGLLALPSVKLSDETVLINVVMKLTDSTAYTFELLSIDGQKY